MSTRPVYAGVAETSVYVGDAHRARGVGKALIHRQVTVADDAGLWTLQTGIFLENRDSSPCTSPQASAPSASADVSASTTEPSETRCS